jgi:hypothetical protein
MTTFNRTLWTIIGLLLLATGGLGLAGGRGVSEVSGLLGSNAGRVQLGARIVEGVREPSLVAIAILAAGGVLAIFLGLVLLRSQLTLGPAASFGDPLLHSEAAPQSRTRVRSAALRHGLTTDLRRIPGIKAAAVSLLGDPRRPRLELRLRLEADRDLSAVQRSVGAAVESFGITLGHRVVDTSVLLWLASPAPERLT